MAELKFDIKVVRGLNMCSNIPLPLFRFIIEEQYSVIANRPNNYNVATVKKMLVDEEIDIIETDAQQAVGSMMYVLRFAINNGWTLKALATFFKENTLLPEDYLGFILERHQNELQEKKKSLLTLGRLLSVNWSIVNCRKDSEGRDLNKLYVKLELTTQDSKAVTSCNRLVLSLPEFRVFMNEWKSIEHNALSW